MPPHLVANASTAHHGSPLPHGRQGIPQDMTSAALTYIATGPA